ncbi:MAG: helix-turn-helix domain-containing protein [Clostridia bacterium]|nr:helix-turn-helix domain-containing protein [Clostridia bacterium]
MITAAQEQYILTHNQITIDDLTKEADRMLTVKQYAAAHGVHNHTVLNWIRANKIPYAAQAHGQYTRYMIPADTVPPMRRPRKS